MLTSVESTVCSGYERARRTTSRTRQVLATIHRRNGRDRRNEGVPVAQLIAQLLGPWRAAASDRHACSSI